jgi:hypothetical protein
MQSIYRHGHGWTLFTLQKLTKYDNDNVFDFKQNDCLLV